jgi:hypothetical protein
LVIRRWGPGGLAELTADRRQLSAALHDGARPPGADEGAVEGLLLAYQELTSNALRHGRWPVGVTVASTDTSWLLEVSDAAADRPAAHPCHRPRSGAGWPRAAHGRRNVRRARLGHRRVPQGRLGSH